jgi:MinD-like ATPase involved in chromosome partitioning or flagellar assembly
MHKTRKAVRFDPKTTASLASYISGTNCGEDFGQATGTENLHLIPSGSLPAKPLNRQGNLRMKALLDEVRQGYHCVIPDTPPPSWYLIFWCS